MRIAVVVLRVQPHRVQQLPHPLGALRPVAVQAMDRKRLAHDRANRLTRVQRGIWILEDHLHLASDRLQLGALGVGDVPPVEMHRPRGWLEQPHRKPRRRALPTARLADDPQRLAAHHLQAHAVHRPHRPDLPLPHDSPGDREVLHQIAHLHQWLHRAHDDFSHNPRRTFGSSRHATLWAGSVGSGRSSGSIRAWSGWA